MKISGIVLLHLFLMIHLTSMSQSGSKGRTQSEKVRLIQAAYNDVKGDFQHMFNECVGAGRSNEGLRADWQEQLRMVKDELGFRYIRMHGLLHDDMGVYFENKDGVAIYNWQYIDVLYDFLISIDVRPFVELSFMPEALASGEKTVFWWKANVTPPASYDKWYGLIRALVAHFTERYGKEEVKRWYFEVWNEPNHPAFWSSDINEYFKLYDYTAKAVKSVCPEYRVGGPASAGNGWVSEIIGHCSAGQIPLDFISTHAYAVDQGFFDATGESGTVLSPNRDAIVNDVSGSRTRIRESVMPDLELHYTEWSASYTPTDPIHDTYHEATFILDKIKRTEGLVESMSYWVFSDIFEENGPRFEPFHGGFGLLNYQGIKKPAYFAYRFMNQLGETELLNDDPSSWICKDNSGNIQALFWDFTITHPGDSMINQVYYKRDLPSKPKGTVKVRITDVPAGIYQLQITRTGYRSNDPWSDYLDIGAPSQLTRSEVQVIKDMNDGKPSIQEIVRIGEGRDFTRIVEMHENDAYLLILKKIS